MVQDKKAEARGVDQEVARQTITQERARRRAAEVADESEDSGFLRQRMEAVLEEKTKAQLAQETASVLQENRPLASLEVAPGGSRGGHPPRG